MKLQQLLRAVDKELRLRPMRAYEGGGCLWVAIERKPEMGMRRQMVKNAAAWLQQKCPQLNIEPDVGPGLLFADRARVAQLPRDKLLFEKCQAWFSIAALTDISLDELNEAAKKLPS